MTTTSELVAALAIHLTRHPFAITVALAVMVRLSARAFRPRSGWRPYARHLRGGAAAASLLVLGTYTAVVVFYATGPQYFDAAEPTMPAIGWLFHVGQPVYHAVDSAERYSHIYGPMLFIVHGFALQLFGATIAVSKWVGGVLAIGALALTFLAARQTTSGVRALVLVAGCATLLLAFRNYSFWTRAEPLQLFCMAAGLVAVHWRRRALAPVVVGLAAGVLWNLKITGPLYSVPLFALLFLRSGWHPAIASGAVAWVAALLPFVVFSNVSFAQYLTWVRLSAGTGLVLSTLRQNLEWTAYLSVPLVLVYFATRSARHRDSQWRWATVTAVAAVCGVVVAGAKPGAGPYHLLPFLPLLAYLAARRVGAAALGVRGTIAHIGAAFLIVAAATAVVQQVQFVQVMMGRRTLDTLQEIERFAASHEGVIEMGYAVNDPVTFQRPVLVFRNNSYLVDQPAVGEHLLAGFEVPPATVQALRECRVNYWLLPKGEAPFSGVNMYPAVYQRPLFPAAFRQAFLAAHDRLGSTEHFDVWQCRLPPAPGGTAQGTP